MRSHLFAAACATAMTVVLATPSASPAASSHRADLSVSTHVLRHSGTTLTGSFVVRNRGHRTARSTTAALRLSDGTTLTRLSVRSIKAAKRRTVRFTARIPATLGPGTRRVTVCVDVRHRVRESSERNNCRSIGRFTVATPPAGDPAPLSQPLSPVVTGDVIRLDDRLGPYWAYVPTSYDTTHHTPTRLLVWMHGCGGEAEGDAWVVHPSAAQHFVAISVGGRDDDCWDVDTDSALVMAAVADVASRLDIDPTRVFLGGYSSGGDLAYRTAYEHAGQIAGVVIANSSPFRDTGMSASQALAAAGSHRFAVRHLLHTDDMTYPVAGVTSELQTLTNAGFHVVTTDRPGEHWDDGTDADIRTYLLPAVDSGW